MYRIYEIVIYVTKLLDSDWPGALLFFCEIVIYITKLLDSDWPWAVLFYVNTVRKRINSIQKELTCAMCSKKSLLIGL